MTKHTLSPKLIIDTSLELIEQSGFEKLSFRSLAKQLEVTPMALYRHFDNKETLLTAMLDAFILKSDVIPSNSEIPWDEWLQHFAKRMHSALMLQPGWLPYLGSIPLQESGLQALESCLQRLTDEGFSPEQASNAFFAIVQIVFGSAITQQQLGKDIMISDNPDQLAHFPLIINNAEQLLTVAKQPQLEIGMSLLISGLEHQLEPHKKR